MSVAVPATVLADVEWQRADLDRAASRYGRASPRVLGTIRWYSASSVVVAATLEPLVHTGFAHDPALESITLDMQEGLFLDARSSRVLDGDVPVVGAAMAESLARAIAAIAEASTATPRSLWAIAADSIASRLLWAASATSSATGSESGEVSRGVELAEELAEAIGPVVPRPRFVEVGARPVLRRCSCCLIYQAPKAGEKCASCPRQTPEERTRRLHALLGP